MKFDCIYGVAVLVAAMFCCTLAGAGVLFSVPDTAKQVGAPAARALSLLDAHRGQMGKSAGRVEGWRVGKVRVNGAESVVRVGQTVHGVPVFGAQALVQLGQDGAATIVADLAGDEVPGMPPGADWVPADAVEALAGVYPDLEVLHGPELMLFDPAVLDLAGEMRYAWVVGAQLADEPTSAEQYFVDAATGEIFFQIPLACSLLSRQIFDANSTGSIPFTPTRAEGAAAVGQVDVDTAYTYAGSFYNFLDAQFGRDGIDGAGGTLKLVVRYCTVSAPCPYANAFFTIGRAFFGEGFALADDVVGHELAHGMTDLDSGLIYYGQPGAINEAIADIFGEGFDLLNGLGDDAKGKAGQIGEDVPGMGAFRSMVDPTEFGDPDTTCSELWYDGPADGGGIHSNNGVINKLAYLLMNGGKFGGEIVAGIGVEETLALFYEVNTNFLLPTSDFDDLYRALDAASEKLEFKEAARSAINTACHAVRIDTAGNCRAAPKAPKNDTCANPRVVTPGVPLAGTNVNARGAFETECGVADLDDYLDVWYVFTADEEFTVVTMADGLLFAPTLQVGLYDCEDFVSIGCSTSVISDPIFPPLVQLTTVLGKDYLVRVAGTRATTGNFTLLVNAEVGTEGEGAVEGEGEGDGEGGGPVFHHADQDGSGTVSLSELLRIIQFYNTLALHCEEGTEDGFSPGVGNTTCGPHSSDYNPQDWVVSLSELLRVIQFYNSAGLVPCEEGEDGYCPVS